MKLDKQTVQAEAASKHHKQKLHEDNKSRHSKQTLLLKFLLMLREVSSKSRIRSVRMFQLNVEVKCLVLLARRLTTS